MGCSWEGMYVLALETLSWLGFKEYKVSSQALMNPFHSWLTGVTWCVTFWLNLKLVLHVLAKEQAKV